MRPAALIAGMILSAVSVRAEAGEAACWFENGAVVAPGEIAGIAGDWLIDPSAPRTLLHETRAEMEGLPRAFVAAGRLAGRRLAPVAVTVVDLDDRAPGFVTPITGVIGADVLARYTVDLSFSPCRLTLWRGRPPPFGRAGVLPLTVVAGTPGVRAAVSDDRRARAGLFAVDWGSRATVRVRNARLEPSTDAPGPTPRSLAPARLRALSAEGVLYERPDAAIGGDLDPALTGALGTGFWSSWRLRLDISGRRLLYKPQ